MKLIVSFSRIRHPSIMAIALMGLGSLVGCSVETTSAPEAVGTSESAITAAASRFFVPPPPDAALKQVVQLVEKGQLKNALLLSDLLAHPSATWFTGGTPAQVQSGVQKTVKLAALVRSVPVLVAYDLPFRDCGGYSAGGALDTPSYEAWIDAFAAGIGSGAATVVLEPDGLGIIPYNTTIYGAAESCQPDLTAAGLTPAQANRLATIN